MLAATLATLAYTARLVPVVPRRGLRRTPPVCMPEGPEVRVHAQSLHSSFSGATLSRVAIMSGRYFGNGSVPGRDAPPLHWETLRAALPATVLSVQCKGKFLWWSLDTSRRGLPDDADPDDAGPTFWSTLGMSGAWSHTRGVHSRVCFELIPAEVAGAPNEGRVLLFYNDQRNFGSLTVCLRRAELDVKLRGLGPSWLAEPDAPRLLDGVAAVAGLPLGEFLSIVSAQCSSGRRAALPTAKFLMDQSKTSGIGNYLLSEILFKARVYPWASCANLDEADWTRVHAAAAETVVGSFVAQAALLSAGGGVSTTKGTWAEIEPAFRLLVYGREQTDCGRAVRRDEGPHGRSVFWVPELQVRGRAEGLSDGVEVGAQQPARS